MPLEIISAEDALQRGRTNREKSFPARNRDGHRLLPFAEVASRPSFSFDADAKVFTAGSCFARNIERSLKRMGYNIVSSGEDFYNPFEGRVPFQRFNKYTIHSILNEIEWALGEKPMDAAALLCETKPDLYCDLQTSGDSLTAPLEEMVKFRQTFNEKFATVADADVVMFTLGLVESWYDNETGTHLNRFPGPASVKRHPGRFSLHVLDHDDIVTALNRTYDVIAKHNSDFKMLVTVSPVPLDRTFRADDILAANCYSKSVQRAAVETFIKTRPVDYFPSYETVTLTDNAYAWSDHDFRHVRGEMVDRLMGGVLERYTDITERQSAQKARGYITAYLAAGDLPRAEEALQAHVTKFDLPLDLMQLAAEIDLRKGDADSASQTLRKMITLVSADPDTAEVLFDKPSNVTLKIITGLLDQCQRLAITGDVSAPEMDRMRAATILGDLEKATPENADIAWLKSYLDRASTAAPAGQDTQDDKMRLTEAAALSRLRALDEADVDAAEKIVSDAMATLRLSEALNWELALIYRKNDRFDDALDLFAAIGRMGGSKAVLAVKHALPLARRLKRHEMAAELAEDVAKTL